MGYGAIADLATLANSLAIVVQLRIFFVIISKPYPGEVAEWSNALDLKSSVLRSTVGSNPTLSAC